jgi:hypothetical protein
MLDDARVVRYHCTKSYVHRTTLLVLAELMTALAGADTLHDTQHMSRVHVTSAHPTMCMSRPHAFHLCGCVVRGRFLSLTGVSRRGHAAAVLWGAATDQPRAAALRTFCQQRRALSANSCPSPVGPETRGRCQWGRHPVSLARAAGFTRLTPKPRRFEAGGRPGSRRPCSSRPEGCAARTP